MVALSEAEWRAERAGLRDQVALAWNYQSLALRELTPDERLDLLRGSIVRARAEQAYEFEARGYTNVTEMLFRYGRYSELLASLDDWLRFTRDRGFWSHAFNLELHAALVQLRRGNWPGAQSALAQLVGRYDDPGMLVVYSLPPHGRLLARQGRPEAEPLLRHAWSRARQQRMLIGLGYAGAALMEWAWLNSNRTTAAEVLAEWSGHADRPTAAPLWAEIRRYARRLGLPVPAGGCSGSDDPWDAGLAGRWSEAADRWSGIGDPYECALELADSGEVPATLRALTLLEDLGAAAAVRVVRDRLRQLGVRSVPRGPNNRTRDNPNGLTDRQVAIATLLSEGLTNSEIADRLVLSVRTVDHHVSAILAKLSVHTRREAAEIARSWPGR